MMRTNLLCTKPQRDDRTLLQIYWLPICELPEVFKPNHLCEEKKSLK